METIMETKAQAENEGVEPVVKCATIPVWPDAAEILGVGRDAVYAAAASGEIPAFRIGRFWRVGRVALERKVAGEE